METARTVFLAASQFCSDTTHANTSSQIFATDSIVSSSTSSSLCSSSKLALAVETKKEKQSTEKRRHKPLFKRRLQINLNDVQHNDFGSHAQSAVVDENNRCNKRCGIQLSAQQLLSLTKQRKIEAQSKLSLPELKQQARNKAKAFRQPKWNKRNGRCTKPRSSAADLVATQEPLEKVEMNTGVLYLYRGENRRAKFVRRK